METLRPILREDAVAVVLGLLLSAAGTAGLVVAALRKRFRDLLLIAFGSFALLYGVRLLADTRVVPLLFDVDADIWRNIVFVVTFIIPIPGLLFFSELFDVRAFRRALHVMVRVQAAVSILEIVLHFGGHAGTAMTINNAVGLALSALGFGIVYIKLVVQKQRSTPWIVLGAAMVLLISAVLNANLSGMGLVRPWRGTEPVVFFIFNLALAYVTIDRILLSERKLVTLESELETARRIQLSILPPSMPDLERLTVGARYEPMTAVAGDFYDFHVAGPQKLGVLVADVSGHGVGAALIASMVKVGFASMAHVGQDPAALLKGLNEILCRQGLQGEFVTAAYVFFDLESDVIRYSAAAHPPVLIVRQSGEVQSVENNGLPLGMMRWAEYSNLELNVSSGERVLLYTDGITEAAGLQDEFFGERMLGKFIASHEGLTPQEFAKKLIASVHIWAAKGPERSQQDDLTVIAIDRA